jgi:hypothetical protein
MTPKNRIKNLKATLEATNQQITIIPTVINIENQAVQDLYAQYRIKSIKNPKTREATLEAFVLKPCISGFRERRAGDGERMIGCENGERE